MSIGKLTGMKIVGATALRLAWDDGRSEVIDFAPMIDRYPVIAGLADDFASAKLSDDGWSVEWASGIDFGSVQMRRWADEQAEAVPTSRYA